MIYNILIMIGKGTIGGLRAPHQKRKVKRCLHRTVIGNMIMMASHVNHITCSLTYYGSGQKQYMVTYFIDFCEDHFGITE